MYILKINLDDFNDRLYAETLSKIESIKTLKNKVKRKLESIAGYYLLFKGIFEHYNKAINELEFEFITSKPFLKNSSIFFNISHSEKMVICAMCENELGADIEKIRKFNEKTALKLFSDNERRFILNGDKDRNYTQIWTLKEAYFKMKGTGISLKEMRNIDFVDQSCNINSPSDCDILQQYCGEYIISVCYKKTY